MFGTMDDIQMPHSAKPMPVSTPMNGTSSMPHDGCSPNSSATISGAQPYTPARTAIQPASAVTTSCTSTGAARIAS